MLRSRYTSKYLSSDKKKEKPKQTSPSQFVSKIKSTEKNKEVTKKRDKEYLKAYKYKNEPQINLDKEILELLLSEQKNTEENEKRGSEPSLRDLKDLKTSEFLTLPPKILKDPELQQEIKDIYSLLKQIKGSMEKQTEN